MPQSRAYAEITLNTPAATVWRLLGDFDALPQWLPAITASQLSDAGALRTLHTADGEVIVERLLSHSDAERTYRYALLQGPLPVRDYEATLQVGEAADGGCVVRWWSDFTADGASAEHAIELLETLYRAGLGNLTAHPLLTA